MPVLVAAAAFIASVFRRPIDARLKRRYVGPTVLVTGLGLLILTWLRLRPPDVRAIYLAGELFGVCAIYLMAWALVLATRVAWLEPAFGGLDRMYLWHRRAASAGTLAMVPHVLLTGRGSRATPAATSSLERLGGLLGALSLLGLLALVAVSLPQLSAILRLQYERWLFLHRLIGLFVASAVLHGVLLDDVIHGSAPLEVAFIAMGGCGLGAYAYDELLMRRRTPSAAFTLTDVRRLSDDVLELELEPRGTALHVKPGQFVFLRIGGEEAWREHPFTVAGSEPGGRLRFTIRALGRETTRMHARLRPGRPAEITGPFGMFDYTLGGPRQLWVGGGIGIAPFLSWLPHLDLDRVERVDLYYCTRTAEEALFEAELVTATVAHPKIDLHLVRTGAEGHLRVHRILADADEATSPATDAFLCGPTAMVDDLTRDLRAAGLSRDHIHAEHFSFR